MQHYFRTRYCRSWVITFVMVSTVIFATAQTTAASGVLFMFDFGDEDSGFTTEADVFAPGITVSPLTPLDPNSSISSVSGPAGMGYGASLNKFHDIDGNGFQVTFTVQPGWTMTWDFGHLWLGRSATGPSNMVHAEIGGMLFQIGNPTETWRDSSSGDLSPGFELGAGDHEILVYVSGASSWQGTLRIDHVGLSGTMNPSQAPVVPLPLPALAGLAMLGAMGIRRFR